MYIVKYSAEDRSGGMTLEELNKFVLACQEANLDKDTRFRVDFTIFGQRLTKIENLT